MKIKLPKDLRGVVFPRVLTIELNDFDIDLFLAPLFFKVLGEGRQRARRVNDPEAIASYIDQLAAHTALEGFDDPDGHRILERLVRTTLIVTGRVGRARRGEQILSTAPYTLLSHKPGFPTEGRRQRGADTFIYQALRERLGADDVLRTHVKQVFGHGVNIGPVPRLGGEYDGVTELDTLTRLSIAFLDGFESTAVGARRPKKPPPNACPALSMELATDLIRYLFAFYSLMPVQALTYNLLALINFELFNYTLKLVHAINSLVQEPDTLPPAMQDALVPSGPQLYLDFTGVPGSLSQEMANAGVRRDLEAYQQFLTSNLLLRQLDKYIEALRRNRRRREEIDYVLDPEGSGPSYLQGLLLLQDDPTFSSELEASARTDENRIRDEYIDPDTEQDETEELLWLDQIVDMAETDIERVVTLLVEGQRKNALENYVRWYWGVGGLNKQHGVLTGTLSSRQTWRYAPSNDLLAVLVQLAAARISSADDSSSRNTAQIKSIRLQDFLIFLEKRFGILVDRPPEPFEGADYAAAARDNLRAMLKRLRQMGIFRDLSDDFTVQRLHPPYSDEVTARVEF